MKWVRLMLVVILSVVIPVNGFAAPAADVCPMQTPDTVPGIAQMMPVDQVDVAHIAMPDCCVEMDSESANSKLCKPGQSCSVGWLYFALPTSVNVSPLIGHIAVAHYLAPPLSSSSATIWHPPRRL